MKPRPITINFGDCPCTQEHPMVTVYPLNVDSVEANVPDGVVPANYRIGRLVGQSYTVIYVGRVDYRQDCGLKDRMLEHIGEFYGNCYFEWNNATSPLAAYKRECQDYHCWGQYGHLENKIHPRKPEGYSQTVCPVCGQ